MAKTPQELIHLKEHLENELQHTIQKYEAQIDLIETELMQLNQEAKPKMSNLDEPQGPWNIEHEGIIRHNCEEDIHLFEREQVFENIHE